MITPQSAISSVTLLTRASLGRDSVFRQQVRAAVTMTCLAVAAEAPATPHHRERRAFAVQCLRAPDRFAAEFAHAAAGHAGITVDRLSGTDDAAVWSGTDSDLSFIISSIYDALAVTNDAE